MRGFGHPPRPPPPVTIVTGLASFKQLQLAVNKLTSALSVTFLAWERKERDHSYIDCRLFLFNFSLCLLCLPVCSSSVALLVVRCCPLFCFAAGRAGRSGRLGRLCRRNFELLVALFVAGGAAGAALPAKCWFVCCSVCCFFYCFVCCFVRCSLFVVRRSLRCFALLCVALLCCLLFIVCCLLFAVYCLLFVVRRSLSVVCCLLCVVCSLFVCKIFSTKISLITRQDH